MAARSLFDGVAAGRISWRLRHGSFCAFRPGIRFRYRGRTSRKPVFLDVRIVGDSLGHLDLALICLREAALRIFRISYRDRPYLSREGRGVASVRAGNIGYSILGRCPVSELRNATMSFSS